jgi:hypothetical protein
MMAGEGADGSVADEFAGAELGDQRLNRRLERIVEAVASAPDKPFPSLLSTDAELEGFYRFLSNDKVSFEALVEPHIDATADRAMQFMTALAVHDTTEFRFNGEGREGLGYLNKGGRGFLGHFCLGVTADGRREPLGVLGVETWARTQPTATQRRNRKEVSQSQLRHLERESARWGRLVDEVEDTVDGSVSLIHVMDSEADDYALMSKLACEERRFVIRLCTDRRLALEHDGEPEKLKQRLASTHGVCFRTVKLSARKRATSSKNKRNPPRDERLTQLAFSSTAVTLRRPGSCPNDKPKELTVNVVYVREVTPPADEQPVEWMLATTEPVDTAEQILAVVDSYRARWLIEEYFKSLKTGCAFTKRQLESLTTLLGALAILLPVAWSLLRMRMLCRQEAQVSAGLVFTAVQLAVLRKASQRPLAAEPTVREAMLAIAGLGGHRRRNGEPGWQVLGRGYTKLLTLVSGYLLAKQEALDDIAAAEE